MALSIGELVGYIKLNADGVDEGLDEAGSKIQGGGAKLGRYAKGVGLAAGAAMAAALGMAFVKAIDIDKGRDRLAAELGLTEKESKRIGGVAGDLFADAYGESMDDVNAAISAVVTSIDGMANASSKRLRDVTAAAINFADVFQIDVARAAQIAGQMIEQGLAKDARQAFDLLTASAQKVPKAIREDLLDAIDEYGPFFQQLGYTGQQAFALLVDASAKGMYGIDKAGDSIKEFTIRATDMSAASQEAYQAIGLDAEKMADRILAGGDSAKRATDKIIDGLLAIESPSAQAQAAIALFGTPLEDLGTKDIPKFLRGMRGTSDAMDDAAGAADRMGDTLRDNVSTKFDSFVRTLKGGLVRFMVNKVIPVLEDVWAFLDKNLGPVFDDVAQWLDKHLVPALQDFWHELTKTGGGVDQVKAALDDAEPFFRVIKKALEAWIPVMVKIAKQQLPWIIGGMRATGKILGVVGKAAIALWNHFFQPMIQYIIRGVGKLMQSWGRMLQSLGRVPGFGWAKDAGDKMVNAGRDAERFAHRVRKIPNRKHVRVTLSTPNLHRVRNQLDWVARPRQARITITKAYAAAGRDTLGGLQRRARGGPGQAGTPYLVGEHGPELWVPRTNGKVIPNHMLNKAVDMQGKREPERVVVRERIIERTGPLIGTVKQAPGEDSDHLAERLWFKTRTRG